jgi:hypothetical protein
MTKQFASKADLAEKKTEFIQLSPNAYAYTAEGDPNSGVIIGDEACMVIDTTATPLMAQDLIRQDPHRHRQADQVRGAVALSRGAGAGRLGLCSRRARPRSSPRAAPGT